MSVIRPEAQETLKRWRGVILAGAIAAWGLRWFVTGVGIMPWLGAALIALGGVMAVASLQRMRFFQGRGGPGVVQVVEGQVAYFGPFDGGSVALTELTRLDLVPGADPACWRLHQLGQAPLEIPVTAEGAENLFDLFATLPGIDTPKMLAELRGNAQGPVVIWQNQRLRLH